MQICGAGIGGMPAGALQLEKPAVFQ